MFGNKLATAAAAAALPSRAKASADPKPAVPLAAAQVLSLQRSAGNQAVASLLQRQGRHRGPSHGPLNDPHTLSQAISLEQLFALYATNEDRYSIGPFPPSAMNPAFTRVWIRGAGQPAIQHEITARLASLDERKRIHYLNYLDRDLHPGTYDSARKLWLRDQIGAGLSLTYEQRIELRRVVGDRMNDAYTDFTAAAAANAAAIKAAANAEAAFFSLFIDVFMGLAAPGIARGIAAAANRIPAAASNLTYRVALASLDTSRTGLILAAATKIGKESIKMNAIPLFGQTDIDLFIRQLKAAFRAGTDAVNVDLPNRTDEELGVLAATYEPSVSDEAHYTPIIHDLVQRFQREIMPIAPPRSTTVTDPTDRTITTQTGIVWVPHAGEVVLTEVELTHSSLDPGNKMYFRTFIDEDLRAVAIAKAGTTQPRGIQEVPESYVTGFPATVPAKAARR